MADIYEIWKRENIFERESEDNYAIVTHLHDTFELNFMLSEGIEVMMEEQTFVSQKGTLFIFPPFSLHKLRSQKTEFRRFVLNFNEFQAIKICSALEPALSILKKPHSPFVVMNEADTSALTDLFQRACDESQSNTPLSDYKKITALGDILYFILPRLEKENLHAPIYKNEIADILTYINDHIQEDLTVDSIAKQFAMSSTTLWRLIKKHTWLSPKEYILNKRLVVASNLLMYGASVAEAAEKSGFNSYSHFIRTFTQQKGISPHKYVQKMLQS